ncbi:staga complex 65 subunit gamma [Holotrichia oblita]|uniref:Staga complex 65 subunit gamma n=1 Tax=Holotrichia oblita TaxID=644536 RepID=A0ACB9SXW4_HOLOL|nr:staga complex 65 subunit gamma [Holotrichia oblita]
MNLVKHWGEIEQKLADVYIPDVSLDIERSMNKFCLAEFDVEHDVDQKSEQLVLQPMDPLMLYAISLHKYANDITEMIRVAELAIELDLIPPKDVIPPLPEIPQVSCRHVGNNLNYIPKQFTAFSLGKEIDVPEISEAVAKQILIKCIATMTAHIGYETTHQSVLDLLTDVLQSFLIKISRHLKVAAEDEESGRLCGFPHIAERVLTELGVGGIRGLHDYYQTRIVKYIGILRKRCCDLNDHYAKLLIPKSPPPIDKMNKMVRVKVEEEDVTEADNPEVHFPMLEGEVGLSSLETGFQLLNSLEAETQLQTLGETEEELTTNASPSVVSIPETEVTSNLSPYAKKKRTK